MKNRIFRTLALGFGLTAIFAISGLNATAFYSGKVNIPFEFRVGNRTLAAGDYRVEQDFGKEIAVLVNIKTGERIQMLRANNDRMPGRTRLTFKTDGSVHKLTKMW